MGEEDLRESQPDTEPDTGLKIHIGWGVVLLGTIAGIVFIAAGIQLQIHGQNLVELKTAAGEGGDSTAIMEVYYNEMGHYGLAYGLAAYAMGASVIAISVGLGALLMKKSILKLVKKSLLKIKGWKMTLPSVSSPS